MQKNRYYEDQIISPLRITSIGGYAETAFFLVAMLVVLLACGWLVTFEKSVLKLHCRLCTGVFKYGVSGVVEFNPDLLEKMNRTWDISNDNS